MSTPAPMDGQVFGHYRLVEQIGAGGMGVVFRAYDEKLRRDVAVKILPHRLFSDEASRERFRKEALAVGRLNHPNIAMAFDFGEENGVDYLVTEYIPGVNLDEKIGKQPLPQKIVLELGIQMLSGLEAAHRENVIHRDLKPGNIRLNRDGQLKILDFGLAKISVPEALDDSAETATIEANISVSGTLPYMAPELLRAEDSDARADIWAAGAVLYEMATGKRAFPDKQPSLVIDAILHYDPVRPTLINPKITPSLEAVILKALDRDPDRRYQSVREFRIDLHRLLSGGEIPTDTLHQSQVRKIAARSRRKRMIFGVVGALALIAIVVVAVKSIKPPPPPPSAQQKILAVLPIETFGQDPPTNALALGLTETLTAKLVQASNSDSVQVVSSQDLRDQKVKTADDARREFGTDYVLESSLQRSGEKLRINCYLVDSKTHRQLAARTIETDAGDAFKLQDQVVNAALDLLPATINSDQRQALAAREDTQPAAYEAYIRGRGYLLEYEKPENIDNAIAEFNTAIKVDPKYAPAYAGLGKAYLVGFRQFSRGNDWVLRASRNCSESLFLNPELPEGHICLANVYNTTGRPNDAIVEFQKVVDRNANNEDALRGLADAFTQIGNLPSAEAAYKQAIALRPNYWGVYSWLGYFYYNQNRYSEAAQMFQRATELSPDNYHNYFNLAAMYVVLGRYSDAIVASKHSLELRPSPDAYGNLGYTYFLMHQFSDAASALDQALKLDRDDWMNWGNLGDALYWSPSRRNEASQQYKKAISIAAERLKVNPQDGTILAYIANYFAMIGDRAKSLNSLEGALRNSPGNGEVLFLAAATYHHLQEPDRALSFIQKAIDAGYSRTIIRDTPEFEPLHSNSSFAKLISN